MVPPEPGQIIDMAHISQDVRTQTEELFKIYDSAFASHKYDTGSFTGFSATIEIEPGASIIEKERPMRANIKHELRPMILDLLREGIIKHADYSGPFLSNCHGVAKFDKNVAIAGKTDLYLMAQVGKSTNHARVTLDLRNLNKHSLGKPKINLPSHRDLSTKFKDHKASLRIHTASHGLL